MKSFSPCLSTGLIPIASTLLAAGPAVAGALPQAGQGQEESVPSVGALPPQARPPWCRAVGISCPFPDGFAFSITYSVVVH
jgi:hypothetical protein